MWYLASANCEPRALLVSFGSTAHAGQEARRGTNLSGSEEREATNQLANQPVAEPAEDHPTGQQRYQPAALLGKRAVHSLVRGVVVWSSAVACGAFGGRVCTPHSSGDNDDLTVRSREGQQKIFFLFLPKNLRDALVQRGPTANRWPCHYRGCQEISPECLLDKAQPLALDPLMG